MGRLIPFSRKAIEEEIDRSSVWLFFECIAAWMAKNKIVPKFLRGQDKGVRYPLVVDQQKGTISRGSIAVLPRNDDDILQD